jgi:hypothetical protein
VRHDESDLCDEALGNVQACSFIPEDFMTSLKTVVSIMALGATFAAVPAQAVITTFASFSPIGTGANFEWKNNGTTSTNGTGGSVFSLATATSTTAGSRRVSFSFLLPQLSSTINNVNAVFTLSGAAPSGNPAILISGFQLQDGIGGSFSFKSTSAITVGNTVYAAGSNLLSATFGSTAIAGKRNGTSASFSGSTAGGDTIVYTSDFLSFGNVVDSDFSISLTSVTTPLLASTNKALRTFKAVSSGSFSTDPAPLVNGVPEPAMWAMMVAGFGMVGVSLRGRNKRMTSVSA